VNVKNIVEIYHRFQGSLRSRRVKERGWGKRKRIPPTTPPFFFLILFLLPHPRGQRDI